MAVEKGGQLSKKQKNSHESWSLVFVYIYPFIILFLSFHKASLSLKRPDLQRASEGLAFL